MRQVGRHWSQQQNDVALDIGDQSDGYLVRRTLRAINFIDQFHDRGDAGIEMPASLEIVTHALDGLVQFALDGSCFRRQS